MKTEKQIRKRIEELKKEYEEIRKKPKYEPKDEVRLFKIEDEIKVLKWVLEDD
ncbi:MAG: hypothetical protein QXO40_04495 [Candidatus Aenigmatarchaeota archaeon]